MKIQATAIGIALVPELARDGRRSLLTLFLNQIK